MDVPAFKASDDGLRRLHTCGELGLREASFDAGLDQQASQRELWPKLLVRRLVLGCLEPLLVQVADFAHGSISSAKLIGLAKHPSAHVSRTDLQRLASVLLSSSFLSLLHKLRIPRGYPPATLTEVLIRLFRIRQSIFRHLL